MAKTKTTARLDQAVRAYIGAEAQRQGVSESQLIGQILDAHMRSAPVAERSIEQAVADLQQHIATVASANHAEVVDMLASVLQALLKLIETSSPATQPVAPGHTAARFFQPNNQ